MADDRTSKKVHSQIITVRSSAGSGKTYRLARHYLEVLLAGALADTTLPTRMANIVAITFTNKAAQEMRARILDWMKHIILDLPFENSPDKPLDTIMRGITTVLPDTPLPQEIANTARKADNLPGKAVKVRDYLMAEMDRRFTELLKDFGHFNVGTIDSFVNLTLKASAMQLNLPPDFEVSTETKQLIDLALRECLQRTAEDGRAQAIFDTFLDSYIELEGDRAGWVPRELIGAVISSLWNEETKENREFIIPAGGAHGGVADLRQKMADSASRLLAALAADTSVKPLSHLLTALERCADPRENALSKSVCFERSLEDCLKKGSSLPGPQERELWDTVVRLRRLYAGALAVSKYIPYVQVYSFFKEVFQREVTYYRRVIPIEELNRLLQDIVTRRDFVPEIYYTLSERYIHFLLDEFQDTSLLQWKNIEVLAEEALSRGGSLFLVGDRKQAIYRWRGGRPELVDEITEQYRDHYGVDELHLDTNYRSLEHVVSFNNEVFDAENLAVLAGTVLAGHPPETVEEMVKPYRTSRQLFLETKKGGGFVSIERLTAEGDDENGQDVFTGDEARALVEERLKTLVRDIMARGVFRQSDLAVLVRTREEAGAIVAVLLSMGLSVESEHTVSIRNNALIREVISFLKFLDKPDDNLSFASFITGRIFTAGTAMGTGPMSAWLSERCLADRSQFLYLLFKSDHGTVFEKEFAGFLSRVGYLPLYDLLVSFYRHWELLARFPDDVPYLLHLLELVREREHSGDGSLAGFIDFLEEGSRRTSYASSDDDKAFLLHTPDSLDAVKVLTIHKAKGLQFPVVILPFVTLTSFSTSSGRDKQRCFQSGDDGLRLFYLKKEYTGVSPELAALYSKKEREHLADELNNLYVAFTRAEEELYILLTDRKKQKNHLIDHIFGMKAFRSVASDRAIVLGRERMTAEKSEDAASPGSGSPPSFKDFTGDPAWPVKLKGSISDPGHLSRHAVRARKKGNAIHRALSFIESLPIDDGIIESFARTAAVHEGIPDAAREVEQSLRAFFTNERFRPFFETGPGISFYNEKEIVDRDGNTFKMDRVIVRPGLVEVIDYKTGEIRSDSHVEQVRRYGRLLAETYPERDVRGFLLYLDDGEVVRI
ncbi:MAG: ATP-dependent helicase/nuclease subunit A [Syntrophorhabdus sp. PtaB.Bin184]|nr:MAG: ATP-dependent helicase/nuclease subunit A [Syntrophorhabdus sp. PtaB.Bin184]